MNFYYDKRGDARWWKIYKWDKPPVFVGLFENLPLKEQRKKENIEKEKRIFASDSVYSVNVTHRSSWK